MKYKDIIKTKLPHIIISRKAFKGILIKYDDDKMDLMNSTIFTENWCPPSMIEGSCSYKIWRGQYEKLYKEDLEADDWYYYIII